MPRKPKHWSKIIEEAGISVRIYERANSSALWYSVTTGGRKKRKSLKTSDRPLAEDRARGIARELARLQLSDERIPSERLTFSRLEELYLHHRGPLLSSSRLRFMRSVLGLLREHLGAGFLVEDFGQHDADAYVAARASGRLSPDDPRARGAVKAGTIRNELHAFSTACNWAARHRRGGRPLLAFNPVRGLNVPREDNPSRPVTTLERYRTLLGRADQADPKGRLRVLLVLAWETGRRINAILHLRAADLLFSSDQLRRALAEEGQDEAVAEHWPQAIRWRPEWDKCGYLDFSPISTASREALETYLRRNPTVGEGWVFPGNEDRAKALDKLMAGYYLRRAEELAGLPHQRRGGWHAFRRAWATRRKHLPVQDVMAAGGWRDVKALQSAYQAADPETVRRVVEGA